MNLFDRIAKKFGYGRIQPRQKMLRRGYQGADLSRLTADWLACGTSGDAELKTAIKTLRDRARAAERDEDYMRRYLALRDNNVIGSHGVDLRVKAVTLGGKPDPKAGKFVEDKWYKWGRKEFCTVSRRLTWNQVCRLSLRGQGRDGGALLRKVRGFRNNFNYAVQPLEIDHLAIDLNIPNQPNEIRFGIELDEWHAPIAYWLYPQHPGDYQKTLPSAKAVRVSADEILHIFKPERVSVTIGAPQVCSALFTMKMLRAYQEAEITAAREAACKGYALYDEIPEDSPQAPEWEDSRGNEMQPVEPGMTMHLGPYQKIQTLDPNHPVEAFGEFCKSVIRSFGAGMGVSYNSLANDLEGVNFSSIRAGLLEEREEWKADQEWLIAELHEPVFEDWLAWQLMTGAFAPYTMADFDRLNHAVWTPRRWPWVDPEKDVNASIKAAGAGLISRDQIIAETGRDKDEVDAEINADPILKDVDFASNYAPNAQPEPQDVPIKNGNGNTNGNGRLTFSAH